MARGLSAYGMAFLSSACSVMDFVRCGSAVSLRRCVRMGFGVSAYGPLRLGQALSVLDYFNMGGGVTSGLVERWGIFLEPFSISRWGNRHTAISPLSGLVNIQSKTLLEGSRNPVNFPEL